MFESFRDRDLKDTRSCDELGAGAPVVQRARGTTRESLIEGAKQKHTQREGLYDRSLRSRGGGGQDSGAVTRIQWRSLLELKQLRKTYEMSSRRHLGKIN